MASGIQTNVNTALASVGKALNELLTLRIQTVVTAMTIAQDADGNWVLQPETGATAEGATTTIRLEQGDVQNFFSTAAIDNPKVMEIHAEQVKLSRQIVADNLKAVADLAKSLTD
ncbi:hypothetical protein [Sphingomonas sp. LM7]|uniref:hypothetical protein n=1 Tax=Sphingomonas sp. LM7 TaxID=1938607 RepID=UPI0009839BB3|nr:hypothetical protein [Sphingomonas sp. LM7]AQR75249.1 hypothetical protein BXU08_17675 [Sphingomonas sp. LM7]